MAKENENDFEREQLFDMLSEYFGGRGGKVGKSVDEKEPENDHGHGGKKHGLDEEEMEKKGCKKLHQLEGIILEWDGESIGKNELLALIRGLGDFEKEG